MRTLISISISIALAALGVAQPALAQIADVCRPVVERDGELATLDSPQFSIANRQGVLPRVALADPLAMVTCERRSIVPLPGDYRVIRDYGVPLTLVAGERAAAVEMIEGRLHVRMVQGQVEAGEITLIQSFLNDAQTALAMTVPPPGRASRN